MRFRWPASFSIALVLAGGGVVASPPVMAASRELCGVVETVAGGGPVGDGGPASAARLSLPGGLALSSNGDLIVVDFGNHRVRRVDARGVITTITGTGEPGFSGDGGPAHRARLARPENAAFDPAGNLLIVDSHNHRIRRIERRSGIIDTVAGTGRAGYGGDGGPARQAMLYQPEGIAFDRAGNYYVGDTLNGRVRRIDAKTGLITTVAGNGRIGASADGTPALAASFLRLARLAVGPDGNVYVADSPSQTIQKIDLQHGVVRVVAGTGDEGWSGDGGPAREARLSYPEGLAFDGDGNLYFGDLGNHCVRRVDAATGVITTIAGTGTKGFEGDEGPASAARLWSPGRIAAGPDGSIYVADIDNARIRRIDGRGIITTIAGSGGIGDGGPANSASLMIPGDLAFRDGRLYVAEFGTRRIRRVDVGRNAIVTVAGGGVNRQSGAATGVELKLPEAIAVAPNGDLFIADSLGHTIWRTDSTTRAISRFAGTGSAGRGADGPEARRSALHMPTGLASASDGRLFLSDFGNRRIRVISPDGSISTLAIHDGDGRLLAPQAVSLAWEDDALYWVEAGDPHLYRLDGSGRRRVYPIPLPSPPIDPAGFQLADLAVIPPFAYLAETLAHRILRLDLRSGDVVTIAGNGEQGFGGDGGPAAAASLFRPGALVAGDGGELYIADTFNHRVRVVRMDRCDSPLERDVVSYRLSNGFAVVVAPDPELKLAAVNLHVAGGALVDPPGRRGMAHLLEHVSLTGTLDLGSRDPSRERRLIREADEAYEAWRNATVAERPARHARFVGAEEAAFAAHEPGDIYGALIESLGGVGMNAVTSLEATQYFCRLPAVAIAEWMNREAQRIRSPLFRDFYRERDVVLRELAVRGGRAAGVAEEIAKVSRSEALAHFRSSYSADRMALAVVGPVDPEEIRRIAEKTFGALPRVALTAPKPESIASPVMHQAPRGSRRSALLDATAGARRLDTYVYADLDAASSIDLDDAEAAILHARRSFRAQVADPAAFAALLAFEEATRGDWRAVERHARHLDTIAGDSSAQQPVTLSAHVVAATKRAGDPAGAFILVPGAPQTRALAESVRRDLERHGAVLDIAEAGEISVIRLDVLEERLDEALAILEGAVASEPVVAIWMSDPNRVMRREPPSPKAPAVPVPAAYGEVRCAPADGDELPVVVIELPLIAESDEAFFAAHIAAHVLGGSHSSRLSRVLRSEQRALYTIEAECTLESGSALKLRIAAQAPDIGGVRAAVRRELEQLRNAGVTSAELEIARAVLTSRLALDEESPQSALYARAVALASGGNAGRDPRVVAALTPTIVGQHLRRMLDPSRMTTIVAGRDAGTLCRERMAAGGTN